MKMSASIKEISVALPKAQAAIKSAMKDATNPHFKSRYADLASVIDACKTALNANGITFLQPVRATDGGVIVETVLLHTSGEWIGDELELPVAKADAQGVGSAITYGRRYGLQALVGVPAEDDDGNLATAAAPLAQKPLSTGEFAKHKNAICNAENEADLKTAYVAAYRAAEASGDKDAMHRFTDLKTVRKDEIKPALATQA